MSENVSPANVEPEAQPFEFVPPPEIPMVSLTPPAIETQPTQEIVADDLFDETPEENEIQAEPGKSNEWKCPKCGNVFPFRSYATRHIKRSHASEADQLISLLPPEVKGGRRKKIDGNNETAPDFSDLSSESAPAVETVTPMVDPDLSYQKTAEMTFDMSTGILSTIFGPEWQPRTPEERQNVVMALKMYMKTKGMPDMPPGVVLAIVVSVYAMPRLTAPPTKAKISIIWYKAKSMVGGMFKRKH